jgi:hypothetical protein
MIGNRTRKFKFRVKRTNHSARLAVTACPASVIVAATPGVAYVAIGAARSVVRRAGASRSGVAARTCSCTAARTHSSAASGPAARTSGGSGLRP